MGEFSVTHLILIAVIALIFFGPSRLPQLGQSIGKAIRGFKSGLSEIDAEVKPVNDDLPAQQIHDKQQAEQKTEQQGQPGQAQKEKQNS